MNTTRLIEIATNLTQLYQQRNTLSLSQWQQENDLAARQLYLVPSDGWPGKNETERKTAAAKACADDETCRKIEAQIAGTKADLAGADAEIAGLEAERRALEWEVRGELVKALQFNHLEYSGAVEETAFDQMADATLDEANFSVGGPVPF